MASQVPVGDPLLTTTRRTLARAFHDDPFMVHLLPDPAVRARRLPAFLGGAQQHCARAGEVWAADGGAAVTCWLPPGRTSPGPLEAVRSGMVGGALRLGPAGVRRLVRVTSAMDRAHEHGVPGPHWYLFLLSVDPDRQGSGLSEQVLRPVLDRADAAGLPVYLDTHNPDNPAFYARHGFAQAASDVVDGLRFWGLLRPPR